MAKANPQFHAGTEWKTGQKYFSIEDAMKGAETNVQWTVWRNTPETWAIVYSQGDKLELTGGGYGRGMPRGTRNAWDNAYVYEDLRWASVSDLCKMV